MMLHTKFKHVGKAYCVKCGDGILCRKSGLVFKIVHVSYDYIITLSNGGKHTSNQLYNLVNE